MSIVQAANNQESRIASRSRVPWQLWCGVLAVLSSTVGLEWDISWHRSIGRDTFWTPAHMMIYLAGLLTGIVCGFMILVSTFSRSAAVRLHTVSVLGFRGPLGCFVAAWGGLAMLVSASFDNWWHDAYGLDVQILSPPHTLLFLGLRMIAFGFLLFLASALNRASAAGSPNFSTLRTLFLFLGGLIVMGQMLMLTQRVEQPMLHSSTAYKGLAIGVPTVLALVSQASRDRWAATWVVSVYMAMRIAEVLIFPLFPATPRLGPVINPITHLMPAQFPILLLVPAIALDLLWQRWRDQRLWLNALTSGVVFLGAIVAVQWPFADFLMTGAARNRFFGTMYFDYSARPEDRLPHFAFAQSGWPLAHGLLLASLYASLTMAVGLWLGRWMRSVQR